MFGYEFYFIPIIQMFGGKGSNPPFQTLPYPGLTNWVAAVIEQIRVLQMNWVSDLLSWGYGEFKKRLLVSYMHLKQNVHVFSLPCLWQTLVADMIFHYFSFSFIHLFHVNINQYSVITLFRIHITCTKENLIQLMNYK